MTQSTGKRLLEYALTAKKTFIAALLLLSIGVAAELAGPFIAKSMIDNHMLAIEKPYFSTTSPDKAAEYNNSLYKRGDRFEPGETKGQEIRVLQAGRSFYFINEAVTQPDGERKFIDGEMHITRGDNEVIYPAVKLSADELFAFYKPELPGIYQLVGMYAIFLVISIFAEFGKTYWLQSSANQVIRKLRTDVYAHIQRLPVHFFDNLPAGKVVSRVTNDTEAIKDLFIAVLSNFSTEISI